MADKKPEKKQECVQVVVRCRPFSTKEKKENRGNIIGMETASFQISITNPSKADHPPKHFTFDAVYDETTQQKAFYEESCYDLVEGVMEGYNGTIFAYGQTGCGKTHTMQGYNDPPELRGVIPHSFDHIFENIKGSVNTTFLVRCCYLEIYNEEVRDLLAVGGNGEKRDKLELKEDANKGVYVKGLTQAVVSDQEGINRLMDQGQKMRTVGATAMNETSSRSHSIFTIVVEINDVDEAGKDHIRVGKLNLVDLAGSERASKTGASGSRLKEGCKINLSLSALGNVISALVDGNGKHIPYRDSKLTRLLQDSLGGNTKTLMVAAISPADYNYEETLSTLRYANRAKNIKNKPKINEDPKDAMLRQYKEEIEALKQQLAASLEAAGSSGGGQTAAAPSPQIGTTDDVSPPPADPDAHAQQQQQQQQQQQAPPLTPPAASVASASTIEDQALQGQATRNASADDDAVVHAAESAAAATAATTADGAEQNGGAAAETSAAQEGSATSGARRSQAGEMAGGGKSDDHSRSEELAEGSQPASLNHQPAPEVVVQEKIVERVVVEEKVVVQEVEVEVESQKMAEHRQALENYSRAIEEQRNRLGQELETSVMRADVEKQAREEMARKLNALQTKVIGLSSSSSSSQDRRRARRASVATRGGDPMAGGDSSGGKGGGGGLQSPGSPASEGEPEDPEVIIARRNAEHRRMQAKLRQKRRKETRLELERVRALEEKAEVEKEMADVVGQAEEKERRLNKSRKKLERKLVEAREEIEDLTMEHETEREELLDSIRNQNKELQLWEQVARQLLSSKEIARIWERGEYNEDEQTWVLPRIKPRASYIGDPCKLPLLAPPGSGSGSRASVSIGGGSAAGSGGGSGSGSRASVSGKEGGSAKRRRSVVGGGRGGGEERPPRRLGEETAPKEGGGGVFNHVDKPWESFAGRENGGPRSKGEPTDVWDSGGSPTDDPYRGLTPPISPAQPHPRSSRGRGSFVEAPDRNSNRHPSHPDSASSSAGGWGFSGDGGRGGEVELPAQDGGGGGGGGGDGGSKADRCPSRQGGTRTGSRATSGSRLGREHRQQQQQGFPVAGLRGDDRPAVPEDSLLRHGPEEAARGFGDGDGGGGERIPGTESRVRAKSRRNKSRPSMAGTAGGAREGGQEDPAEGRVDWGNGSGEQATRSSGGGGGGGGSSKKDRRPKSKARRGDRGDLAAGRRADEGEPAGYPSLLDSALWKGGGGGDEGTARSTGSGPDLYDFGG